VAKACGEPEAEHKRTVGAVVSSILYGDLCAVGVQGCAYVTWVCGVMHSHALACTNLYMYACVKWLCGVVQGRATACAGMHTSIHIYVRLMDMRGRTGSCADMHTSVQVFVHHIGMQHCAEPYGIAHGHARMRTSHSRVGLCGVVRGRACACTYSYIYP
jgi:hypothetical protein